MKKRQNMQKRPFFPPSREAVPLHCLTIFPIGVEWINSPRARLPPPTPHCLQNHVLWFTKSLQEGLGFHATLLIFLSQNNGKRVYRWTKKIVSQNFFFLSWIKKTFTIYSSNFEAEKIKQKNRHLLKTN